MKIAIPLVNCRLATRFGHCNSFALFDVDPVQKAILRRQDVPAPEHQPDNLPAWLERYGVDAVIAAGMGRRAMALLTQLQIGTVVGAKREVPEKLVQDYLGDNLEIGENLCDGCFTVKIQL